MSTLEGGPGDTIEQPRRKRGRPRSPGAEQRIIDAALEEYGQQGWSGFTMDGVARRAGVGKSTVYLRWQDKDSLLTAAVHSSSHALGMVDTGSMRGDLEELAANMMRHFREPAGWATLRITIDTAGATQRLGTFAEEVTDQFREFADRIVRRAIERGEVPADLDSRLIADCVYGPVVIQSLAARLERRTLEDPEVEERVAEIVDVVLHGLLQSSAKG
jgi:AcrR family transcriptional regulator